MSKRKRQKQDKKQAPKDRSSGDAKKPAVRPFWSGTIAFGLVSVPVDLFPAKRSRGISLRMLTEDGIPVERRYFCPEHEVDVHPEHILRGYENEPGDYVIVRDDELDALSPRKSREIDLQQFVDIHAIDPVFFDRPYFLAPSGDTAKAYRLLAHVMEESEKIGIATFVMRNKEYLVAILAEQGLLRAETLRFADEIRAPEQVGLPPPGRPAKKRVKTLKSAIRKASLKELPRDRMKDEYAELLHQLVEQKRKTRAAVVQAPKADTEAAKESSEDGEVLREDDLLQTIKRSMQAVTNEENGASKKKRSRSRAASEVEQKLTKDELYERAKQLEIPGRSQMSKAELIEALSERR